MQRKWSISISAMGLGVIVLLVGGFWDQLSDMIFGVIQRDFTVTPSGVTQQDDVYVITFLLEDGSGRTLTLRLDEDAFNELKEKLERRTQK